MTDETPKDRADAYFAQGPTFGKDTEETTVGPGLTKAGKHLAVDDPSAASSSTDGQTVTVNVLRNGVRVELEILVPP